MNGLMVLNYFSIYILLSLLLWAIARYAYYINEQLPADDPKKKPFHPMAVSKWFPIFWPVYFVLGGVVAIVFVLLYILKALLYGIFLTLLVFALVIIRRPFLFIWLGKIMGFIGGILLQVNTMLLNLFRIPLGLRPQTI